MTCRSYNLKLNTLILKTWERKNVRDYFFLLLSNNFSLLLSYYTVAYLIYDNKFEKHTQNFKRFINSKN